MKFPNIPLRYQSKRIKKMKTVWSKKSPDVQRDLLKKAGYPFFINRVHDVSPEAIDACLKISGDI